MTKAVFDKAVPTRNLITTIAGVITLVITILVGFGILTPEQSVAVQSNATIIVNAVITIWGAVSGLILIFKAKDA